MYKAVYRNKAGRCAAANANGKRIPAFRLQAISHVVHCAAFAFGFRLSASELQKAKKQKAAVLS
jgi:hypothetical protein